MPKSKVRKKTVYVAPGDSATVRGLHGTGPKAPKPSPSWYAPLLGAFLVIGLAYIVTYYVASDRIGFMNSLGSWNFAIGFGFLLAGLTMAVRWR